MWIAGNLRPLIIQCRGHRPAWIVCLCKQLVRNVHSARALPSNDRDLQASDGQLQQSLAGHSSAQYVSALGRHVTIHTTRMSGSQTAISLRLLQGVQNIPQQLFRCNSIDLLTYTL